MNYYNFQGKLLLQNHKTWIIFVSEYWMLFNLIDSLGKFIKMV